MLQTFLPLFLMTFGICLFIVLMQFLWRYIDDMVVNAPANHHHQYYKYRGFLLPELCHACGTSQTLHATLVYAAEIAGARYS